MRHHRGTGRFCAVILAMTLAGALTACGDDLASESDFAEEGDAAADMTEPDVVEEDAADVDGEAFEEETGEAQFADEGDFVVVHVGTEDPALAGLAELIATSQAFEPYIDDLNSRLALPQDVEVRFTSCGEANAFYDPGEVAVSMCYELLSFFIENLGLGDDEIADLLDAGLFTLFHEIGHALVDQLGFPITGREEDAADELAAITLLDYGDLDGTIAAVEQFSLDAEEYAGLGLEDLPYWDEHSLSQQRYYDVLCLLYGSAPEAAAEAGLELPEERAEQCAYDYEIKRENWDILLEPHMKI